MRALVYHEFGGPITVAQVPDPVVPEDGVLIDVGASGLCRSDWHGWQGHDADITALPHVPGHEFAGTVVEVGIDVRRHRVGDRVLVPFTIACGACARCGEGDEQICDRQYQPGFHGWGSHAELVAVPRADRGVLPMPESLDWAVGAFLGCRFATAHRAVLGQGRLNAGEWLVVHGCGGVGLSAVMVGAAHGAQVVAVDPDPEARRLAVEFGASVEIDPAHGDSLVDAIVDATHGGPHLSIDAVGSGDVVSTSLSTLRKRGRHVQIGLLQQSVTLELSRLHSAEVEMLGSHGMPVGDYAAMLDSVERGVLEPGAVITRRLSLFEAAGHIVAGNEHAGVAVITEW